MVDLPDSPEPTGADRYRQSKSTQQSLDTLPSLPTIDDP